MSSRPQPSSSSIEEPSNQVTVMMEPKETQSTTSDGDTNNINSKQDQTTPSPAPTTLRTSARERKPIRTIGELWIAEQQQLVQLGSSYGGSNKKNKGTAVVRHAPRSSGSVKAPTKTVPKKTEPTTKKKTATIKGSNNSNVPGITWRKEPKVFMVRVNTGRNKRKYIGQFKTFEGESFTQIHIQHNSLSFSYLVHYFN